ncbi:conjugal transfer protein TraW [Achromobacter insuavis]|uniref:conjugal transfer protein TraW n=1 Tax=Achromobacter insuavis TaxID=1287735 RepID=UPI001F12A4E8|nr:conjugal transfer protein TraW [Achromobacter insuavis]
MKRLHLKLAAIPLALALAAPAANAAMSVFDAAVVGAISTMNSSIVGAISTLNGNIAQMLQRIGTAINSNGSKIASAIETAASTQKDFAIALEKQRRTEDARQNYQVLQNICSESASGGAVEVGQGAGAAKGVMRPGGGGKIENPAINQAINSPPVAPDIDTSRAAKINSLFCDADDFAAFGGSQACRAVAKTMPGAVKRVDSVLSGAGPNGKAPDRTFSQAQTDVARMYVHNSVRRSVAPQLSKGDANTPAGANYIGLMTMLQALLSAAADPMEQRIADSQPSPSTAALLQEALNSPSAAAFYKQTASAEAKKSGAMSAREFEFFEVGRRYANTEYQADLQAMSGDNLLREQIRVSAMTNWLLHGLKEDVQRGNIINGELLASTARQEYGPLLSQQLRAVAGAAGGTP